MHPKNIHPTRRTGTAARRPQPALIVAIVALVAATGGSAAALPGSNTVDRNDVKKNAIRSKAIKNGQVAGVDLADGAVTGAKLADGAIGAADLAAGAVGRAAIADGAVGGATLAQGGVTGAAIADGTIGAAELANGAVNSAAIADGTVGAADIAPMERYGAVGAPGEPQFFDGGEGDCVWKNALEEAPGTAPAGFAKDALGRLWLRGVVTATAGPGGDGKCDRNEPGEAEDGLVFRLPPGYRPEFLDYSGAPYAILIAPSAGAEANGISIPPGGVYSSLAGVAILDGVSIRPAADATQAAGAPAKVSPQALSQLAD